MDQSTSTPHSSEFRKAISKIYTRYDPQYMVMGDAVKLAYSQRNSVGRMQLINQWFIVINVETIYVYVDIGLKTCCHRYHIPNINPDDTYFHYKVEIIDELYPELVVRTISELDLIKSKFVEPKRTEGLGLDKLTMKAEYTLLDAVLGRKQN